MKINENQKLFLLENYESNSMEQLVFLFFEKYKIKLDKSDMARTCRSIGLVRGQGAPGRKRKQGLKRNAFMKQEKDDFIKENINKLSFPELCNAFRLEFNEKISNNAISMRIFRLGLNRTGTFFKYEEKHNSFLIQNFKDFTYEKLKTEFNKKFETNVSVNSLKHHCLKKLGLRQVCRLEVGQETKRGKRILVKISKGNKQGNYQNKGRFIYEQEHGKIPDGYCVLCLDGDRDNCDLNNLSLISKRQMSVLAGSKWLGEERYNMTEKIKYAELICALKESEEI